MPTETDPDNPGSPIEFGPGELEALKAAQEALCRAPGSALRTLLETSVVLTSSKDDVTICVTKIAYEAAYDATYGPNAEISHAPTNGD